MAIVTTPDQHWNAIFAARNDPELGWYESDPSQTLKFLDLVPRGETGTIFLPGAGTSILVDELLSRGHDLILNDISDEALRKLKQRLPEGAGLRWLHHDMTRPLPDDLPLADVWIDRAVLHFLLDEAEIQGYFDNLWSALRPGGYALMAEFSTEGATMCAGLNVHRYSLDELSERMGDDFELIRYEHYTFTNPRGEERPYIYALYRKQGGR